MASSGIRDQVAIIGMGCTRFGELWDKGVDDLLTDAATEAAASAGMSIHDIDAFWLGTMTSGVCGVTLSRPLKLDYKPVTRVENYCATGSEAFRNACYAVASGAYDTAMAIGVEKLKDTGYSGLTGIRAVGDGTDPGLSSPAAFSFLAPSYANKYGVDPDQLKEVMSRIAFKNHQNGARNPRAQFRKEVSMETIAKAPLVAGDLGVFDCSGVSDGSAAAIICRAEDAHLYSENPLYVKALSFVAGPAAGPIDPGYDYTTFEEVVRSAADAYAQAGITDPRAQLAMAEVHDCFTPTELVLMEDLGFAERGTAWKEVLAGTFDRDGDLPVNPDGGLKSFGHPIGASGLRMLFECWLQLREEAPPERQINTVGRGGRWVSPTTWAALRVRASASSGSSAPSSADERTGSGPVDLLAESEDQSRPAPAGARRGEPGGGAPGPTGRRGGAVPAEVRKALAAPTCSASRWGSAGVAWAWATSRRPSSWRRSPGRRVLGHLLPADVQRTAAGHRASRTPSHEGPLAPRGGRRRRARSASASPSPTPARRCRTCGRRWWRTGPGAGGSTPTRTTRRSVTWPRGCSSGAAGPGGRGPRESGL